MKGMRREWIVWIDGYNQCSAEDWLAGLVTQEDKRKDFPFVDCHVDWVNQEVHSLMDFTLFK